MTTEADALGIDKTLRADFPILERRIDDMSLVYLDSAATSLKPRQVIGAMNEYFTKSTGNIHRGKHRLSEEASALYEDARSTVARMLGCGVEEVVFVTNTTHALNLIASGLGLCREDLVLVSLDSHHSNALPWRQYATTQFIRLNTDGTLDINHLEELLALRPKAVALTHCSNVTGMYSAISEAASLARRSGAIVIADVAQSVAHRRIQPTELGVDFLAFSGHKMLGPPGIGVLYGRRELLARLSPIALGGGTVEWFDADGYRLRDLPYRLEAGTPNISGAIGLASAIDYLERIGWPQLTRHDRDLAEVLCSEAGRRDYVSVLGAPNAARRSALISMKIRSRQPASEVARLLSDSYGIMCRAGHLCSQPLVDALAGSAVLRASAYLYNESSEIRALFEALDELRGCGAL